MRGQEPAYLLPQPGSAHRVGERCERIGSHPRPVDVGLAVAGAVLLGAAAG